MPTTGLPAIWRRSSGNVEKPTIISVARRLVNVGKAPMGSATAAARPQGRGVREVRDRQWDASTRRRSDPCAGAGRTNPSPIVGLGRTTPHLRAHHGQTWDPPSAPWTRTGDARGDARAPPSFA